ncbi:MAG: hypothetical protein IT208_13180 [Chthonomonadales bacterium]|nr:hypothetical protein [Chthonomonadales bacterium]
MMSAQGGGLRRAAAWARRRPKLLALAVVAVAGLGVWARLYMASPAWVARRAAGALQRLDADALVALASPTELEGLRITPRAVRSCLADCGWRGGAGPRVRVGRCRPFYGDVLNFECVFRGPAVFKGSRKTEICVYQAPSGRWRLALSHLLFCVSEARFPAEDDTARHWDAVALHAGMIGACLPGASTRFAADGSHANAVNLTGAFR